jgi:UDP-N-acetylglucosamine 3-dehydrogenase
MLRLGILSLAHPHATGNHIPALKYMCDRILIKSIFHDDKKVAAPWISMFDAKYCGSREELLEDPEIDAVLITSENYRHAEDCIAAAKAGKVIFCDKPIATSVDDAIRIHEAVKSNSVVFITTFPCRFNTSVQRIKRAIDQGALGKILAIAATNHGCMYEPGVPEWVLSHEKNGGGCIIDHTVHVADLIRWFTGEEFEKVSAFAKRSLHSNIQTEDIAVLHGTMSKGAVFQIDASWSRRAENPMWGDVTLRIIGNRGAAFLDLYNNQRLELYSDEDFSMHYPNLIVKEHGDIFDDYLRHINEGSDLVGADDIDGLRTIELVEAVYKALDLKDMVTVNRFDSD